MSDIIAPYPECMAPDGAEPCPQYTALLAERDALKAEIAELEERIEGLKREWDKLDALLQWKSEANHDWMEEQFSHGREAVFRTFNGQKYFTFLPEPPEPNPGGEQ